MGDHRGADVPVMPARTPESAEGFDALLFGGCVSAEERLPLRVDAGGAEPVDARDANVRLLAVTAALAEHRKPSGDDAEEQELARVNDKLDLVLEMLSTLVGLHRPPPPAAAVRWSTRGLCWSGAAVAAPTGSPAVVELHLHARALHPLRLTGRIVHVDGDRGWLEFEGLDDAVESALERDLFRRHRRSIAGVRAARG